MKWLWKFLTSYGRLQQKNKRAAASVAKVGMAAVAGAIGFKAGWKLGKKL